MIIEITKKSVKKAMPKETIDAYNEEMQIYSAAQFDIAIVTLKNSLIG